MEIINVIEIVSGILNSVNSFVIINALDPFSKDQQITEAERLFERKALENGMKPEDLDDCLIEGTWDDHNGYEVLITWSEVNL